MRELMQQSTVAASSQNVSRNHLGASVSFKDLIRLAFRPGCQMPGHRSPRENAVFFEKGGRRAQDFVVLSR